MLFLCPSTVNKRVHEERTRRLRKCGFHSGGDNICDQDGCCLWLSAPGNRQVICWPSFHCFVYHPSSWWSAYFMTCTYHDCFPCLRGFCFPSKTATNFTNDSPSTLRHSVFYCIFWLGLTEAQSENTGADIASYNASDVTCGNTKLPMLQPMGVERIFSRGGGNSVFSRGRQKEFSRRVKSGEISFAQCSKLRKQLFLLNCNRKMSIFKIQGGQVFPAPFRCPFFCPLLFLCRKYYFYFCCDDWGKDSQPYLKVKLIPLAKV